MPLDVKQQINKQQYMSHSHQTRGMQIRSREYDIYTQCLASE